MVVRTSKKRHGGGSRAAREYHGHVQYDSSNNRYLSQIPSLVSFLSAVCLAMVVLKQRKQTVLGLALRPTSVLSSMKASFSSGVDCGCGLRPVGCGLTQRVGRPQEPPALAEARLYGRSPTGPALRP
jgi:hypothetical protein